MRGKLLLTTIALTVFLIPGLAEANHGPFCAGITQIQPNYDGSGDDCYAVIDASDTGSHDNITEHPSLDTGYCCNLPADSEPYEQNGDHPPVTRAYCTDKGGDLVEHDGTQPRTAICQGTTGTTTYNGYVINASNDAPVTQATIHAEYTVNGATQTANRTTNGTGYYNVSFQTGGEDTTEELSITAEKSDCQASPPLLPSQTTNNITICTDADNESNSTGDPITCGDGVIEGSEECEATGPNTVDFAEDILNVSTKVCDTQACKAYVQQDPTPACDQANPPLHCADDTCPATMNMTVEATATVNEDETRIDVNWAFEPSLAEHCKPAHTELNISGPGYNPILTDNSTSRTLNVPTAQLNDSEAYTVEATAVFSHTGDHTATDTFTPYIICDGRRGESFCTTLNGDGPGVLTCDTDGTHNFNNCGGEVCSQTSGTTAACVASACEDCAGAYKLFSKQPLAVTQRNEVDGAQPMCQLYYASNTCYYEAQSKQDTVRGQTQACEDITSCAQYQSQQSCQNNPCNKQRIGSCKWQTIHDGFGDGFCRSANPENVDASLCRQCGPSGCDKHLCQNVYGNVSGYNPSFCFYNRGATYQDTEDGLEPQRLLPANKHRCMSKPNSGCATYNEADNASTKLTCLNGSAIELNDQNQRIQTSDDYFNFDVCDYSENIDNSYRCFKDADDNNEPDCVEPSQFPPRNERCTTDLIRPTTTVAGVNNGEQIRPENLDRLSFDVNDNEYNDDRITTYVNYSATTRNSTSSNTVASWVADQIQGEGSGTHTFTYWSEDAAHNPEVKKTFTFTTYQSFNDALNLTLSTEAFTVGNATAGNITATVQGLSDTRTYACEFTLNELTPSGNTDPQSVRESSGEDPQRVTFAYQTTGTYQVEANCNDDQGLSFSQAKTARFDFNPLITNVTPFNRVVRAEPLTLSAETNESMTCQYGDTASWNDFSQDDTTTHTVEVEPSEGDGIITHRLRCTYNDTSPWIYGDDADTIMYAVDDQPPSTTVNVTKNGILQNDWSQINADTVQVTVACKDRPQQQWGDQTYNYGCTDVTYCKGTQSNKCTLPGDAQTYSGSITVNAQDTRTIAEQNDSVTEQLKVLEADTGGNQRVRAEIINPYPGFDLQPPKTTLSGLPDDEQKILARDIFDASLNATDNRASPTDITTYVSYNNQTHTNVDGNAFGWLHGKLTSANSSTHTFSYWSEDPAGNKEQPKQHTVSFYDDFTGALDLTLSSDTYNTDDQEARGEITATVGVLSSTTRSLTCQYTLNPGTPDATTKEATNTQQTSVTFSGLQPGQHAVTTTCTDGLANGTFQDTENTRIDLDKTITNSTPYYEAVTDEPTDLSINTQEPSTCQYNRNTWTPFTTTGGTTHNATITPQPTNGLAEHQVRCKNTTTDTWIYGDTADTITYVVDTDNPRINVTVTDQDGNQRNPDTGIVGDAANINPACTDRPTTQYNGETINVGCNDTMQYCTGTQAEPCSITPNSPTITSGSFEITAKQDQDKTETATIQAKDNAGHTTTTTFPVNLIDDDLNINVTIQPR